MPPSKYSFNFLKDPFEIVMPKYIILPAMIFSTNQNNLSDKQKNKGEESFCDCYFIENLLGKDRAGATFP